ncbi:MAG: LPXTG cell wall anchor domain-containing protein, partial [Lachnospiraceae bacterium]|nr:LPXTG cell wall anchor domain-containing protein [Lachnospiraceae bacterium]
DLKDDRTYTYFTDGQDSAGDVYTLLIIDGGYLHSWQYDVTLEAEYASPKPATDSITIHWSSIDGVDLADPVVIEFTPGMTYSQVLETKGWTMDTALFEKEGYRWIFRHELKPITDFANEEDPRTSMWDERLQGGEVLEDGTDVYCMMYKEVDSAEVTIVPPACGTETTTPQDGSWWKWDEQTNRPVFSTPGAAGYHADAAANGSSWESNEEGDAPFIGTFKGGQEYFAELWLEADFGYAFKEDPHDTYGGALAVNGATLIRSFWDYDYLGVSVRVPVEHDWSDWKTNKEPSETEDGEESRTCALCGETETRPIPHQAVEYRSTDGDGKSWEKGSTNPLTFTFKRNRSDETTLSHFTGIRMDGADVDPSKYTKVSGSVIITLPPAYLETLSAGKHTLDALFNDGNTVTVYFNVTDKTVPTATPVPSKPVTPNTGDNSNPGLWAALLAISVLGLAFMLKRKKA